MKKIIIIIALMLLSWSSFAQFDPETQLGIEYNNLNQQLKQQQNEIGSIIKSDVEAQIKQRQMQTRQSQTQTRQNQMQTRQNQTQTAQQQAIESYTNKMSIEGQIRMEHINNPDNYIDRSITNRKPALNVNSTNSANRYNSPNQPYDLRTRPIHSEELTSKSLQMLHEANREYFSNEDRETTINPNAQVPLFEAPSLGVPLFESPNVGEKSVEEMDMEAVYAELTPGQKAVYDRMKKEILEQKEYELYKAEVWAEMAKETVRKDEAAAGAGFAIIAEEMKEKAISKAEEKFRDLDDLAREAVRNNRNK